MKDHIMLLFARSTVLAGGLLLVRLVIKSFNGAVAARYFSETVSITPAHSVAAFCLGLAVPFHVVSVGFFLMRARLSPLHAFMTRIAVVTSGCWLAASLVIRWAAH